MFNRMKMLVAFLALALCGAGCGEPLLGPTSGFGGGFDPDDEMHIGGPSTAGYNACDAGLPKLPHCG